MFQTVDELRNLKLEFRIIKLFCTVNKENLQYVKQCVASNEHYRSSLIEVTEGNSTSEKIQRVARLSFQDGMRSMVI